MLVPGAALPDPALTDEDEAKREEARELIISRNNRARVALIYLPLLALVGLVLAMILLPLPGNLWPFLRSELEARPLGADLLAVMLFLELPIAVTIIMGSLGGSIYGQLAGSRTVQLTIAYALPYSVGLFGPAIALGSFDFRAIVAADSPGMLGVKLICGLSWLLCMPVRLRLRPLATSPGEALEGVTTDLSGPALALMRLMEWTERAALPFFATVLFVPYAYNNPLVLLGGVAFGLGAVGVVDAFFSQVRLRDALNFYLRYASLAAIVWFMVLAFLVKI
jgi:formate hydrogenlyase subunit 4